MWPVLTLLLILGGVYFIIKPKQRKSGFKVPAAIPNEWKFFLHNSVQFYRDLIPEDKKNI